MADVVDRLIEAVNAHDMEACLRCYSLDATMVGPELQAEGWAEIESYHAHVWEGVPDTCMTVWDRVAGDGRVAIEATFNGTHTGPFLIAGGRLLEPSGRKVNVHECWMFTVEHDLITALRLYFDQLELYMQLGASIPFTSP
ncbi:ester cyclase [Nonomuraea terrae]|uniref:ester cyclase n=1 Tax=Nonomuraea terrae TaxID=2530383 RepID=UPI00379B6328